MATESEDCSIERLIPFNEPLNRECLLKTAEIELNETEKNREDCLQQLKELIKERNVCCNVNDDFLLRFLRSRKFQVERSFDALKNYARTRTCLHPLLSILRSDALEAVLRNNICGILPHRDYEGRQVIFVKPGNWKKSICTDEAVVMSFLVLLNFVGEDESAQIKGIHLLADEGGNSLENAMIIIRHTRILKDFVFNSFPARYRCIHVINEPWHFRIFYAIMQLLLPSKIRSRVILHGKDRETLFQHIPPRVFPKESENGIDYSNDLLVGIMTNYLHKFKEEQQYFLNEKS